MTEEEILREISSLPPEGRRQLEDFVALLRERYRHSQAAPQPVSSDWQTEGFVGMWRDRDEMRDGSAWVRGVRESEWVK